VGGGHVQYSYVWQFARRVLCISASSAPSERVFSFGGNIVKHKRCILSLDIVNVLVTLKENFGMIGWGLGMNEKERIVKVTKEKVEQQKLVSKFQTTVSRFKIKPIREKMI
jgi:hypothetical protein